MHLHDRPPVKVEQIGAGDRVVSATRLHCGEKCPTCSRECELLMESHPPHQCPGGHTW